MGSAMDSDQKSEADDAPTTSMHAPETPARPPPRAEDEESQEMSSAVPLPLSPDTRQSQFPALSPPPTVALCAPLPTPDGPYAKQRTPEESQDEELTSPAPGFNAPGSSESVEQPHQIDNKGTRSITRDGEYDDAERSAKMQAENPNAVIAAATASWQDHALDATFGDLRILPEQAPDEAKDEVRKLFTRFALVFMLENTSCDSLRDLLKPHRITARERRALIAKLAIKMISDHRGDIWPNWPSEDVDGPLEPLVNSLEALLRSRTVRAEIPETLHELLDKLSAIALSQKPAEFSTSVEGGKSIHPGPAVSEALEQSDPTGSEDSTAVTGGRKEPDVQSHTKRPNRNRSSKKTEAKGLWSHYALDALLYGLGLLPTQESEKEQDDVYRLFTRFVLLFVFENNSCQNLKQLSGISWTTEEERRSVILALALQLIEKYREDIWPKAEDPNLLVDPLERYLDRLLDYDVARPSDVDSMVQLLDRLSAVTLSQEPANGTTGTSSDEVPDAGQATLESTDHDSKPEQTLQSRFQRLHILGGKHHASATRQFQQLATRATFDHHPSITSINPSANLPILQFHTSNVAAKLFKDLRPLWQARINDGATPARLQRDLANYLTALYHIPAEKAHEGNTYKELRGQLVRDYEAWTVDPQAVELPRVLRKPAMRDESDSDDEEDPNEEDPDEEDSCELSTRVAELDLGANETWREPTFCCRLCEASFTYKFVAWQHVVDSHELSKEDAKECVEAR